MNQPFFQHSRFLRINNQDARSTLLVSNLVNTSNKLKTALRRHPEPAAATQGRVGEQHAAIVFFALFAIASLRVDPSAGYLQLALRSLARDDQKAVRREIATDIFEMRH